MTDERRGRGNPGKGGTLEDLFEIAVKGIGLDVLRQVQVNLDNSVFGGASFDAIRGKFKVGDIEVVARLYEFLNNKTHFRAAASEEAQVPTSG